MCHRARHRELKVLFSSRESHVVDRSSRSAAMHNARLCTDTLLAVCVTHVLSLFGLLPSIIPIYSQIYESKMKSIVVRIYSLSIVNVIRLSNLNLSDKHSSKKVIGKLSQN